MTGILPRILATVLLLVSLAMIVPLVTAAVGYYRGDAVAASAMLIPLIFLGTGAVLTWLLAKKAVSLQLFAMAFALWIVAAGYFFFTLVA